MVRLQVEELKAERDAIEAELKEARVDLRPAFLAALASSGAVDEPALALPALHAALQPLRARADDTLRRQEALAARSVLPPAAQRRRGRARASEHYTLPFIEELLKIV